MKNPYQLIFHYFVHPREGKPVGQHAPDSLQQWPPQRAQSIAEGA